MKQIIAGAVFAGAIAAGVVIAAGPAAADNGVIHMEARATEPASAQGFSATPDATAIEYGLVAKADGGAVHTGAHSAHS
ncbi:hypothetical protein ACIA8C_09665 [Nocardia sp. NPDC051321]|uniref:hypothetical protein n=1 Tax=Nocardia sp. NPDC051321 TaxID=3364323 RepID=UPI003799BDE5